MAQESSIVPMTKKLEKPHMRRNSTGKLNSADGPHIPIYLRASTGSCHDFCKHGKKQESEAKAPIPKRTNAPKNNSRSSIQSADIADRKKATVGKLKHGSPDSRNSDPKSVQHEDSSRFRKELFPKPALPNFVETTPSSATSPSSKLLVSLKPRPLRGMTSSSADVVVAPNRRRNSDVGVIHKKGASQVEKKASAPSLNRVAATSARKQRDLKVETPVKNQKLMGKAEPKKFVKGNNKVIPGEVRNLKVGFPLKIQDRKVELVKSSSEENLLHVVEMETEMKLLGTLRNGSPPAQISSPSLSSPKSSTHPSSPFPTSNEEDEQDSEITIAEANVCGLEDDETANLNTIETSKLKHERRMRKTEMVLSGDNYSVPTKLEFSRGKAIDLDAENNEPRRRTYESKVIVDGESVDSSPEKVVLRHQDAEEKKDAQGLFNNMIEKTASKLVETRKSKVKALVSAFETVISLQDRKSQTFDS